LVRIARVADGPIALVDTGDVLHNPSIIKRCPGAELVVSG
jgi:hypothetical protein